MEIGENLYPEPDFKLSCRDTSEEARYINTYRKPLFPNEDVIFGG